ncbi:hypothetical protein GYA54_04335 [Candidatus Kuenenbacteria bacterium]|nr:hypothetical protein [Candidatus Kuenenbacteria bacterium]
MFKINEDNKIISQATILAEKIEGATNILIFTHKDPDTDAIGSLMVMSRFLSKRGKNHQIFLSMPLLERFFYLKESVRIIDDKTEIKRENFDLIIGLDCSNLDWSGIEEVLVRKKAEGVFFVNIDHHPNSNFADLNIVDKGKASTTLLLYNLFVLWKVEIDERTATQILAGLIADTNCFTNTATGPEAYFAAAELLRLGARYTYVVSQFQRNDQSNWFATWSKILSRLTKNDKINLAYSVVLPEDVEGGGSGILDGATNFLSNLSGIRMAMIIKESASGEIKVSMRSLDGKINVAKLAHVFGGGGHEKAAGFSLRGRIERENRYWQIV